MPGGRLTGILLAVSCASIGVLSWLAVPVEVVFGDAIIIRRRFQPDRRIEYGDITTIGVSRIAADSGRFGWAPFENGGEVDEMIGRLIQSGVISQSQLDDDAVDKDISAWFAASVTQIIMSLLAILLSVGLISMNWIDMFPPWLVVATLPVVVLLVAYLVIRRW